MLFLVYLPGLAAVHFTASAALGVMTVFAAKGVHAMHKERNEVKPDAAREPRRAAV